MEKNSAINLPLQISELSAGLIFATVSILSFFMPFTLGHPQWLVGTVVNACLFLGAAYLPQKYFFPLAIFPSMGVLARGLVFGQFTYFLVYFLPFIWLGNLVLILLFKKVLVNLTNLKYVFSVFCAAVAKFLFLWVVANIYFSFHIVPRIFVSTMGLNQLATALAGGLISWILFNFYGRVISRVKRAA